MTAFTMTRRTAVGAGITMASLGSTMGPAAFCASAPFPADALLVDNGIAMPRRLRAFVDARRRTLPVAAIGLDANGYVDLKHLLATSQCVFGFSSGATLFCVERIAWDHGFRLVGRTQRCATDLDDDARGQDVLAFLDGAQLFSTRPGRTTRVYIPSRSDGALHFWAMRRALPRRDQWS